MIRELLTLAVNNIPVQYYISFSKDRKQFQFQPTLKNDAAPSFEIINDGKELMVSQDIDPILSEQAKQKVKEILSDEIFDRLK